MIASRYRVLATAVAVAAAVAVAIGARARARQGANDEMPSGLVRVDAIVENSLGQFAPGLTRDDFAIAVDDQPRPVEWLSSDPLPLALAVLVDISNSQNPGDQNRATVYAPNMINPGGLVFGPSRSIPQFNLYGIQGWDRVRPGAIGARLYLSSRFVDNSGDLQREWSLVFNQGPARWYEGSAMWDAVAGASTVFANTTGRPAIILVTDGEASGNLVSSRDAAERAALAGVSVSVVAEEAVLGFGPEGARKYGPPGIDLASRGIDPTKNLKMLAEATGGLYAFDAQNRQFPFLARSPAPFVAHEVDALHHAYTLGFRPSATDDLVHTLTVSVRKPGLVVHARQEYRSAPPPASGAAGASAAHASAAVEKPPFDILGPAGAMDLTRVQEWIAAVTAHQPGVADAPAVTISQWSPALVAETIEDVAGLARAVAYRAAKDRACVEASKARSGDPSKDCAALGAEVLFYRDALVPPAPALDLLFGLSDAEIAAGTANRVLERGALLHTDIALLAVKNSALVNHAPSTASAAARISDGEVMAIEDTSHHWAAARRLLDSVESNPDRFRTLDWTEDFGGDLSRDELVRDWYRLTSAFHLTELHYQYATPGLVRGSEIFPADPVLLFYRGMMHEIFAMPLHQGAAQSLIRVGASLSVQAPSLELQQAEHDLRLAVAGDPSQVEARLRLGRVLGLLGRHDEAARQLELARDAAKDARLAYLTALFLGRELETAGDIAAARASFERAAALFPQAQSPLVAQSALARRAGEPPDALPALQQLLARPSSGIEDPWWSYGLPQLGVPEAIIARLRYEFAERTAR